MHKELSPHAWEFLKEMNRFEEVIAQTDLNPLQSLVRPVQLRLASRRAKHSVDDFIGAVRLAHPNMSIFDGNAGYDRVVSLAQTMIAPEISDSAEAM